MTSLKTYLGDGVYADFEDGQIVLTSENGIEVTNTIYLEPEVIMALGVFTEKIGIKEMNK